MNHSDEAGRDRAELRSFKEVIGTWTPCLLSGVEGI